MFYFRQESVFDKLQEALLAGRKNNYAGVRVDACNLAFDQGLLASMERLSMRWLKCLDKKGVEVHRVVSTRTLVRTLSTKIKIAIQVVDKISIMIKKLRDNELWPQINELFHMFNYHQGYL
ncbi:hypothetical protein L1049_026339 [Liquidambar formosana]|uniref:DUF632 domain-containing protein n=1 Tax=Liquidambar formosana TaxID=63359 RepID=A0AAP0NES4_LIQFO